ncbi:MAG: RNA 2',3'-cyclic phosphodiesterase [Phycisphaerae bacterium]|jgi:2'-5' RNA ligase
MPTRTFLALDVDESIRTGLAEAQHALTDCGAKCRLVAKPNLHVTVQFLGDVADEQLREVLDTAAAVAGEIAPFDFHIRGLLAVPPTGLLRMVWAMATDPTGRMGQLQEHLAEALGALGFRAEERSFKPHITLVRIKFAADPARFRQAVQQMAERDFGLQHAAELVVYSSDLRPGGPVYTPLAHCPLGR